LRQDDIYDEIDYDELRGPAAVDTISLDVQEVDESANGNGEDRRVRGIIPGKSDEVTLSALHSGLTLIYDQELLEILSGETMRIQAWEPDFRSICIPTPPGGWEKDKQEATDPEKQAAEYHEYSAQREGGITAMTLIKSMHLASNVENNAIGLFILVFSLLC
jgi:hypothetical protein